MAVSKATKTHYLRAGEQTQVACGRMADEVGRYVDGNKPIAHPSGRLMSAGEKRNSYRILVTCVRCRRQGQL